MEACRGGGRLCHPAPPPRELPPVLRCGVGNVPLVPREAPRAGNGSHGRGGLAVSALSQGPMPAWGLCSQGGDSGAPCGWPGPLGVPLGLALVYGEGADGPGVLWGCPAAWLAGGDGVPVAVPPRAGNSCAPGQWWGDPASAGHVTGGDRAGCYLYPVLVSAGCGDTGETRVAIRVPACPPAPPKSPLQPGGAAAGP